MAIEDLIRARRAELEVTQTVLADLLCRSASDPTGAPGRDAVKRWEAGKVIPGPHWQGHLALVLGLPLEQVREEAHLSRVNRRHFLGLAAMTAAYGTLASDLVATIAGGDAGALAMVQTTHDQDIVMASLADPRSVSNMRRWALDGESAVLRVNAVGILAKVPDADARQVATILDGDGEVRRLYQVASPPGCAASRGTWRRRSSRTRPPPGRGPTAWRASCCRRL